MVSQVPTHKNKTVHNHRSANKQLVHHGIRFEAKRPNAKFFHFQWFWFEDKALTQIEILENRLKNAMTYEI